MKFIDLFGGIGGFRLGIEQATKGKWKCVWYCDNDKYAVQTYNKNFNERWEATDVTTTNTDDIPDFDVLCGGFPCQAFSIAGKRRGFEDTRGSLFFEIARIIKAKRPSYLFLENVKGLLNHDNGKTFRVILRTISELGYNVQWVVLNSKFFGVPQNRERVFIIGSLRGKSRPEIFPFRENAGKIQRIYNGKVSNTIQARYQGHSNPRDIKRGKGQVIYKMHRANEIREYDGESPTLTESHQHKGGANVPCLTQVMGTGGNNVPMIIQKHHSKEIRKYKDISPTLGKDMGGNSPMVIARRGRNPDKPSDRTTGMPTEQRFEINKKEISNTLSSVQKDNLVIARCLDKNMHKGVTPEYYYEKKKRNLVGYDIANTVTPDAYLMKGERKRVDGKPVLTSAHERRLRRLTPIECERLQGFPDNWTEGVSDTQRYKQLGNAVTVNVIEAIVNQWIKNEN